MNTIYKYQIPMQDVFFDLLLPLGYKVLTIQVEDGTPQMWIVVDTDGPRSQVHFRICGTGEPIENLEELDYLGTFQKSSFVFHLFRVVGVAYNILRTLG